MRIKSQKDFWSGVMFFAVGAAFAWGATGYSFGNSARPGPGYFPFGLGVLLAVLGAVVLFKAVTVESEGGDKIGAIAWRPMIIILGSVAAFGFLLPRLGLMVSLPLLVFCASIASDEFDWKASLLAAALLSGFSWLIFIKGLSLTIPLWPTVFAAAAAG